jgi:hypothetical protein
MHIDRHLEVVRWYALGFLLAVSGEIGSLFPPPKL